MAHRLGCALAERLAGIAAVAGSYPAHQNCHPTAPLPVLAFHGTVDYYVPYEGDSIQPVINEWAEAWAQHNGCQSGPNVISKEGSVLEESWQGCQDRAVVSLNSLSGFGHQWPGSGGVGGLNATDVIWTFFEEQR